MAAVKTPCSTCGELQVRTSSNRGVYCPGCRPRRAPRPGRDSEHNRSAWKRLSKQARSLQDSCLDCGMDHSLTADHAPRAWLKRAVGLSLDLADVEVRCTWCNNDLGSSKLGTPRFSRWLSSPSFLDFMSEQSHGVRVHMLDAIVSVDSSFVYTKAYKEALYVTCDPVRGCPPSQEDKGVPARGVLPKPVPPLPWTPLSVLAPSITPSQER